MIQSVRRFVPALGLSLGLVATAAQAFAAISLTGLIIPRPAGRNAVAFDSVNRVYLMIAAGFPIRGQFLDQNGNPVTGLLQLTFSEDGDFAGAPTVTFGGPPNDPTFLVTFRSVRGSAHFRYGRLVRYRAGQAPDIGPAILIADLIGDWFATEKGQAVWNGNAFIVGTKIGGGLTQPYLHFFHMNNVVTGGVHIGDWTDYQGSPSLTCSASVCMAAGYGGGYSWGTGGVVYSRRFDPNTLQPVGPLFHQDDHSSRADDPAVIFNSRTGLFLTAWWQSSHALFRKVSLDGTVGPLGQSFGPGAGDIALRYNSATGTTLLATKWADRAELYAVELNDELVPSPSSPLPGTVSGPNTRRPLPPTK